eukprot:jgi/Hompol1/431/HPOL_000148-RA
MSESSFGTVDSMGSHLSIDPPPSMSRGNSAMSQRSLRDELVAEESADEILLKAFEDLEEKRSSTRELALCSIIRSLSHRFQGELIDAKLDSWFEAIKRVAQRQGREALLSNRVLALCWISVGSNPKYYDDVLALLQNGIRNGTAEHKASVSASLASKLSQLIRFSC